MADVSHHIDLCTYGLWVKEIVGLEREFMIVMANIGDYEVFTKRGCVGIQRMYWFLHNLA